MANRDTPPPFLSVLNILPVTCGVPQGSILGPLLFLLYVNDLGYISEDVFCMLFADDTSLLFSDKDVNRLKCNMNIVLQEVMTWFQTNKLSVNIEKTNFMIYHSSFNKTPSTDFSLEINGTKLKRIDSYKFFGIWFDERMNWKCHVLYISKKISKSMGILKKVRRNFGKNILIQLDYILVYPYMLYCHITWATTYISTLDKSIKLQKRIIRVITFSAFNSHTDVLFEKYKILKFFSLDKYLTGIFMYKVKNNIMPIVLRSLFTVVSNIHNYNTRQLMSFYIFKVRTNLGNFSIKYHGPIIWNSIPPYIQNSTSIYLFKKKLKQYLLEEQ